MPTRAETAINSATEEADGYRVFAKPAGSNGNRRPQFRLTPTEGGYFLEEAIGGGVFWQRRAYALTASDIGADNLPDYVWEERKERAERQAEAWEALRKHKVDPQAPLKDIEDHEEREVRQAVETLKTLRWLLVWPAEVVAEHIAAYQAQWGKREQPEE